ncbi:hypothetical protein DRO69_03345 [Candidatus Bathyarchaeota archaeon]|nr:MAG: hypothetical protein DRO69_03345 [Candidatus Bathyarchaeota archaeon]
MAPKGKGGKREVLKQIKTLQLGDLVEVFWHDASKGEARIDQQSEDATQFDVPVRSVGYFLGIAGRKTKHLIMIRDVFELNSAQRVYDVDFNSVPIGMICKIRVALEGALDQNMAVSLKKAFLKVRVRKRRGRIIVHTEKGDLTNEK